MVIPRLPVAVGVPVLVLDVLLTTKVLMPRLSSYVNGLADNTTPHIWLLVLLGLLVPVALALRL